jgi:hypothetical protein
MNNYHNKGATGAMVTGVVVTAMGIALGVWRGEFNCVGIGIMLSFIGYQMTRLPVVRFGKDCVEIRPGPFHTKRVLPYAQIQRIDASKPGKLTLLTAKGPTVALPTKALKAGARDEIQILLKKCVLTARAARTRAATA